MRLAARPRLAAWRQAARAAGATLRGDLPPRYAYHHASWFSDFWKLAQPALRPGARILDVGSGRRPVLPVASRPADTTYVGLDLSRSELESAPAGSYDETVVSDISQRVPDLEERFDLIVSWQVLEHVPSLPSAIDNLHAYLVDGGLAVALFSGRYSAFGLFNMALPPKMGAALVAWTMRRDPETVFPAYYDHCHLSALQKLLVSWSHAEIRSVFCGAPYFAFARPLQAGYILYEEWAAQSSRVELATHYLMQLRK